MSDIPVKIGLVGTIEAMVESSESGKRVLI